MSSLTSKLIRTAPGGTEGDSPNSLPVAPVSSATPSTDKGEKGGGGSVLGKSRQPCEIICMLEMLMMKKTRLFSSSVSRVSAGSGPKMDGSTLQAPPSAPTSHWSTSKEEEEEEEEKHVTEDRWDDEDWGSLEVIFLC